ncbi:D-ribose pyranase [Companilactobacillus alimentarius]|uniref:D-ribose pyranase n=1 Tax=Companilactobacillus alimentarius DSM 20249 TaxID=1423720 RepID=A0A2K9HH85_9LACO|nr:D-ribose pyranase [Companilactobacillus alimentarius]AUI71146.1 D-ribose pyranase [Companilactobacillus alimentarius DSM 20249]KRK75275.1 D-ribose pyranase [Companilactobacillus alimentarius DSM 20249]MDT6951587.1 D-ribose pyranase [Companilactobacillus alimentarius]GEO43946.1 D-ribose pyranase [Companilactobacillus alimentarius]
MKKGMVLNTQVSSVIADMGHFDTLSIGDAGMPVPEGTKKIDLAVQKGLPSFIDVLKNVLSELQIQKVYLAEEIKIQNPDQLANIKKIIDVPIEFISHNDMKKRLGSNKAFIRTGEASPYSNIILESGVTF